MLYSFEYKYSLWMPPTQSIQLFVQALDLKNPNLLYNTTFLQGCNYGGIIPSCDSLVHTKLREIGTISRI